ncbi:DUF547 domain-containing protein [Marinirhabdus gelatinilytica]|uniref:Uncharacterized protein DUF547 n=1 Tax=Marinirhabdus gelatinilytica TaxID=1703343 RepID=A0A370QM12_9FLAO|nr:DUF547 domain-containing protein [Marinirhabdus gelatinilytica]RDK89050.1 uncharacterized protein DUF547 [Marinirhabdus gelatinilytica]
MKKSLLLSFLFFIFLVANGNSQNLATFFDEADSVFSTYVSNGKIAYKELAKDPSKLEKVLTTAATISVSPSDAKKYQAFWINAYNLAVIKGIVDNWPITSPLDKKGFFDTTKYELGGTKITLNDIENKKLRATFNEPRFHFVLVCGALGCPPIIPKAYTPSNLEALLQQQTVRALNDPNFIRVKGNKVAFSEIFKWYKEDFLKNGNEIDFLNNYRKEKVPIDAKVTYYTYDWRLNEQ